MVPGLIVIIFRLWIVVKIQCFRLFDLFQLALCKCFWLHDFTYFHHIFRQTIRFAYHGVFPFGTTTFNFIFLYSYWHWQQLLSKFKLLALRLLCICFLVLKGLLHERRLSFKHTLNSKSFFVGFIQYSSYFGGRQFRLLPVSFLFFNLIFFLQHRQLKQIRLSFKKINMFFIFINAFVCWTISFTLLILQFFEVIGPILLKQRV